MNNEVIIAQAISNLANTMRMYGEAYMDYRRLFKVDPEEAINNLDRIFEMKLEAFHTLYDVSKELFPYFEGGDTTMLIAVRNAIHHRSHPLFHSFNRRLHIEDGMKRWLGASFLFAIHPTRHGSPILMSHHFRLDDLDARLDPLISSPYLDTSLKKDKAAQRLDLIDVQLGLSKVREVGLQRRYPKDQVYLDMIPIFVSAVCKVFKALEAKGIRFRGFDAETYMPSFTSELQVDLANPELKTRRLTNDGCTSLNEFLW